MSDDSYGWYCPVKKIKKCNVSPKLIESQFTVFKRQSFAIKRTETPLNNPTFKSNKLAKLESKCDNASSWQITIPKQRNSKHNLDQRTATTQKNNKIKNLKTTTSRKFSSPSRKSSKIRKLSRW